MMQRILVIDDQPEILEIIEMIVSNYFDCKIDTASNVDDALDLCNKEKYNVICTDYIMPNFNGADLIKFVRDGSTINKDSDILIITGNQDMVDSTILEYSKVQIVNKMEEVQNLVKTFEQFLKA